MTVTEFGKRAQSYWNSRWNAVQRDETREYLASLDESDLDCLWKLCVRRFRVLPCVADMESLWQAEIAADPMEHAGKIDCELCDGTGWIDNGRSARRCGCRK